MFSRLFESRCVAMTIGCALFALLSTNTAEAQGAPPSSVRDTKAVVVILVPDAAVPNGSFVKASRRSGVSPAIVLKEGDAMPQRLGQLLAIAVNADRAEMAGRISGTGDVMLRSKGQRRPTESEYPGPPDRVMNRYLQQLSRAPRGRAYGYESARSITVRMANAKGRTP